jgi:hypothetical protein
MERAGVDALGDAMVKASAVEAAAMAAMRAATNFMMG